MRTLLCRHLLVAGAGLAMLLALPADAQAPWYRQRYDWRDRDNRYSQAYEDGYRDGGRDREHRRSRPNYNRWRRAEDRRAYQAGYEAGYRAGANRLPPYGNGDHGRGSYGNGPYGGYGGYGPPAYGRSPAAQIGYQDGFNDGQRDRHTGHSYRPTEGSNYKHADRGYSSGYGSKDLYKQEYRQAYSAAYQRGYYGR